MADGIFDILRKKYNRDITNVEKDRILKYLNPKTNNKGEFVDVHNKPISYKNNIKLKRAGIQIHYPQLLKDEYEKCRDDIFYFIENYCKIMTNIGVSRIEIRDYQRKLLELLQKDNDDILNMPRQSGKSITTALFLIHNILFNDNIIVGILANKLNLAMEILDKIKKIYVELPLFLQQNIVSWNKTYIELENGCKVITSAANNDSFRGYTIHLLVVDEVAFISNENWELIEDSIFPSQYSLSKHKNILISTPNGLNHWYHKVKGAIQKTNGYDYYTIDWRDVPRYDRHGNVMSSEDFKDMIIKKYGIQHFKQNYSLEFLGSSKTLISSDALKTINIVSPKHIDNSIIDNLRVYEYPQKQHNYVLACDPNKGGLDKIGIQIIDVTNLPFIQSACCQANVSYLSLPMKLAELGKMYNQALIIVENNIDNAIVDTIFYEYEYENVYKERNKKVFGFNTNRKSKRLILAMLKSFIENDKLTINDEITFNEMNVFVDNEKGSYEAQEGFHDDMMMSLALAMAPFIDLQNFNDYKNFVLYMEENNQNDENIDMKLMCDLSFSSELSDNDVKFLQTDIGDYNDLSS